LDSIANPLTATYELQREYLSTRPVVVGAIGSSVMSSMDLVSSAGTLDIVSFEDECLRFANRKYCHPQSPYIASRIRSGYYSPVDCYETLLHTLVKSDTTWLDVGGGRAPFPNNLRLSEELSSRCRLLVGIDPDGNIKSNRFVHERHQAAIEQFNTTVQFDLVTARMVVEHVDNPSAFAAALARVTKRGSLVVFFTVNSRSLSALAARCSPLAVHHIAKKRLWNTNPKDTFPTAYKMNRRITLRSIMKAAGFAEIAFRILPDASVLWRFRLLRAIELAAFRAMRRWRIPYCESCILAVYQRL
jgi:2-polyprenyl-3-methyl-5-hydroxy-6-metoxy-1,4-benzoquinol methylase